jgi:hypothetical protein
LEDIEKERLGLLEKHLRDFSVRQKEYLAPQPMSDMFESAVNGLKSLHTIRKAIDNWVGIHGNPPPDLRLPELPVSCADLSSGRWENWSAAAAAAKKLAGVARSKVAHKRDISMAPGHEDTTISSSIGSPVLPSASPLTDTSALSESKEKKKGGGGDDDDDDEDDDDDDIDEAKATEDWQMAIATFVPKPNETGFLSFQEDDIVRITAKVCFVPLMLSPNSDS